MKETQKKTRKFADFRNILILEALALIIGVFLIASTVIISKDGILYISHAAKVGENLHQVLNDRPGGFPVIIFAANKIASFAFDHHPLWSWIYPAQITVLITRLVAILCIYYISKTLVKKQNAFWACLIIIFLPYPADIGVDVLRGYPALMFISAAYACLFYAVNKGKLWIFALAGLLTALGYFIRPFSIQVIFAAVAYFIFVLINPAPKMTRIKALLATVLMLTVFSASLYPYITYSQKKLPAVFERIMKKYTNLQATEPKQEKLTVTLNNTLPKTKTGIIPVSKPNSVLAAADPEPFFSVAANFFEKIGEMLLWYFLPAWLIGIYILITRKQINPHLRYLFAIIIILNIAGIITRYISHPDMSRRYFLPLITLSASALPIGLKQIACWIDSLCKKKSIQYGFLHENCTLTFITLVSIGILICFPKLLRPKNIDKIGYLKAAQWINKNTLPDQSVRVPDKRIGFYAQRKYNLPLKYNENDYFVLFLPDENDMVNPQKMTELLRLNAGKGDKKQVVIYKKLMPEQKNQSENNSPKPTLPQTANTKYPPLDKP